MTTISNKVRYYHSGMAGAPALTGAAGALIAVLDACLVNGWDSKVLNTLVVSGGIATATISAGHSYGVGDVIRVAGASPAALNGDWRLAEVTGSTAVWSVAGLGIADGSASGTMTAMRAPAGWEKIFSAPGRAAYRSLTYSSHYGLVLYVDDTGTTTARTWACASMSDIDTPAGRFPLDAQQTGGLWWGKAHNTTGARFWSIAADDRRFTFCPEPNNSPGYSPGYAFGRLAGADDDPWATAVSGADTATNAIANPVSTATGVLVASSASMVLAPVYIARSYDGLQQSKQCASVNWLASTGGSSSGYPVGTLATRVAGAPPRLVDSDLYHRGALPGPAASWWYMPIATVPVRSVIGVPGNGAMVMRHNTAQVNTWLLDLGQNGRWD